MRNLDANFVARGLLGASEACAKDQAALCARLMQGAECILEQAALIKELKARIAVLEESVRDIPPTEPLPAFLRKQAD